MRFRGSARRNLEWAREHIERYGVTPTVKKVACVMYDFFYEWFHGTETSTMVWSDDLVTNSPNKAHANCYQPSKAWPFSRLLSELNLSRDTAFVDVGAGKGRMLLVAAEYGFNRVVGVELCANLSAQARHNVEIFRKTRTKLPEISVVNSDAIEYSLPDGDIAFYLNNSFRIPVLVQFLEKIQRALDSGSRRIWMIYSPAIHDLAIQESGVFHERKRYEFGGVEFIVYSAGPRADSTAA